MIAIFIVKIKLVWNIVEAVTMLCTNKYIVFHNVHKICVNPACEFISCLNSMCVCHCVLCMVSIMLCLMSCGVYIVHTASKRRADL